MNPIWQTIRYDVPWSIRQAVNKSNPSSVRWNMAKLGVGSVLSYMLAGALLNWVRNGFSPDEDEDKEKRQVAAWSASQITQAIPIVGDAVTQMVNSWADGKMEYDGSSSLLPAFDAIMKTGAIIAKQGTDQEPGIDEQAILKALHNDLSLFVPLRGPEEILKATGIGQENGPDLGALFGRKDQN
jgi:hypothetical protein